MICASWTICARCASVSMAASRRAAVSVIDYTSVYYAVSIAGVKVIAQVKHVVPLLLRELGQLADRLSVTIELPSAKSLALLAPDKPVAKRWFRRGR